jgi:hypothetical protein
MSTRSVGRSLAQSFKAGDQEGIFKFVASVTIEHSTVADATKVDAVVRESSLEDWAKLSAVALRRRK